MLESETIFEPPVLLRRSLNKQEKKQIGKAVADLISADETIILMGGSTTSRSSPI